MASNERVTLTAELRDEVTAPLKNLNSGIDATTKKLDSASKRTQQSTKGMGDEFGRFAKQGTSASERFAKGSTTAFQRFSGGMRSSLNRGMEAMRGFGDRLSKSNSALGRFAGRGITGLNRSLGTIGGVAAKGATAVAGIGRAAAGIGRAIAPAAKAAGNVVASIGRIAGSAVSAGASLASSLLSPLARGVTKAGKVASILGGLVIAEGLRGGLSRAMNIEDAEARMRGMGYAADDITELMDNASDAIMGTAYRLDDAATAAAQFSASGVDAGEDMERVIGLVGDSAFAAGTDFSQMSEIWAQVAARGQLDGQTMNRLLSAGVGITSELADKFGVAEEEVASLVSEGSVSFEDFAEVMEDKVGGAAQEMATTTRGALMNVQAGLHMLGAEVAGPFMQLFRGAMNRLQEPLFALAAVATPVFEVLTERAEEWATGMYDAGESAAEGITAFVEPMEEVAELMREGEGFFDAIKDVFDIGGGDDGFLSGLTDLVGVGAELSPLGGIIRGLAESAAEIGEAFSGAFDVVMDALREVAPVMGDAFASIGRAIAPLITTLAVGLADVIAALLPAIIEIVGVIAQVIETIMPVVVQIIDLVVGFIGDALEQLAPLIVDIVTIIGDTLTEILPLVMELADALLPVVTEIATILVELLGEAFEVLAPIIVDVLTIVLDAVVELLPHVLDLVEAFKPIVSLFIELAADYIQALMPVFEALIEIIVDMVDALMPLVLAWADIAVEFNEILLPVLPKIAEALLSIVEALLPLLPLFLDLLILVLEPLLPIIEDLAIMFAEYLAENMDELAETVEWLADKLAGFIEFLVDVFAGDVEWVNDILEWFSDTWDTLSDAATNTWETLSNVGTWITETVEQLWEDAQPFLNFMSDAFTKIGDAADTAWNDYIWPALTALGDWVVYIYEEYISPALGWILDKFDTLASGISGFWENTIQPTLAALGDFVTETVVPGIQSGVDAIMGIWETVAGIFREPINWVIGTVWNAGVVPMFNKAAETVGFSKRLDEASLLGSYGGGTSGSGGRANVPGYAKGGLADRGWAIVGEEGPELVNFSQPGRVYTADETQAALGGGGIGSPLESLNQAGRNALDWTKDTASSAYEWGRDRVEGAVEFGRDVAGNVISWVRGKLADAAEAFIDPIIAPMTGAMKQWGSMGGLAGGVIESGKDGVLDWIRGEDDKHNAAMAASGSYDGVFEANPGGFNRPAQGPISSRAGRRSYWGAFGNMHYGVDIANSIGSAVRAAWSGVVKSVSGSGNDQRMVLNHGSYDTAYFHNSAHLVGPGDTVTGGQRIARMGTAGTGPHLHFEYHPGGWYNPSIAGVNRLFDDGGVLPTGTTIAQNNTGLPEYVLTDQRFGQVEEALDYVSANLPGPHEATAGGGAATLVDHRVTVESGAVQISVEAGPDGFLSPEGLDALKEAVEEIFEESARRDY